VTANERWSSNPPLREDNLARYLRAEGVIKLYSLHSTRSTQSHKIYTYIRTVRMYGVSGEFRNIFETKKMSLRGL